MDNKQFCFIICTNNEILLGECMEYLKMLYVPVGYTVDALTITEAKSMTSGNNEGMRASEAKYKIYMHQDVFITNRYFLYDLLDIFNMDTRIGLIGMVGYAKISEDAVMWHEKRYGANPMYGSGEYKYTDFGSYRYSVSDGVTDVKVADGLLLATQYDIEWDEEFDAWDFYDASQCVRFSDAGYRVVVPNQRVPWFVHDDGLYLSVWNYNRYRKLFMTKYMNRDDGSKKIAFITCVNNEKYYDEFKWYTDRLVVPEGYSVELIPIRGASSMAEGYNQGMRSTNAKYKIYVHQDVFFVNTDYLNVILDAFQSNPDIGMIGTIGTSKIPEDADCWDAWDAGCTMACTGYRTLDIKNTNGDVLLTDIKLIDGMFMATQCDIEWRTDIGNKWDFYDISQSIEFLSHGFKIGILCTAKSSMIHDCGCSKLVNYDESRQKLINAYDSVFRAPYVNKYYKNNFEANAELFEILRTLFDKGYYEELYNGYETYKDGFYTDIQFIMCTYDIYNVEKSMNIEFSFGKKPFDVVKNEIIELRFLIRRNYYFPSANTRIELKKYMTEKHISKAAVSCTVLTAVPPREYRAAANDIIVDSFF